MAIDFIHQFIQGTSPVTILALHGTGGDENDLLPIARAVAPGASVLSPRGKALEDGAVRFFTWKADEVLDRAEELGAWLGEATARYGLDPERLYALGYSNGANIAHVLMMVQPGALAGAVLLRPARVLRPDPMPALENVPVLIVSGKEDAKIPAGEGEALGRLLAEAGAAVDFALQDAGRELTPQDFALAKRWLAERSDSASR